MTERRNDKPGSFPPRMMPPRRPVAPLAAPAPKQDARPTDAHAEVRKVSVSDPQIVCPHCRTAIALTQTLAAPLIAETRRHFEQALAAKETEWLQREAGLELARQEVADARRRIEERIADRLETERAAITDAEATRARHAVAEELGGRDRQLATLRRTLADKDEKLAVAQAAQAEAMRRQRDLDEARREFDLTVEKRVRGELAAVRDKARLEVDDALKSRLGEKEAQIAGMQRQIEDLRRKADQGSQQLQGEAPELELEARLRARFRNDRIEPVPKGEFGGDVLHRVVDPTGRTCGTILWECKRTRNWSDAWLPKLRDDQRAATADFAMLVTSVLPKGIESFDLVDDVWVVEPRFAIPLAMALRQSIIDIAASRLSEEGQKTKMDLVYGYLTGPRFRHRIEAIVERFTEMQADLDRERKATTRLWAKRDQQLRAISDATSGLYGDLQGIAGRAMHEIESLDTISIEPPRPAATAD